MNPLAIEEIRVPQEELRSFLPYVLPQTVCEVGAKRFPKVAEVRLTQNDGSEVKLGVYWTGHNPAAVSVDGVVFFYAKVSEFPDGAIQVIRFLHDYNRRG
ncbi:MAG: hypothetical protein AAF483_05025 [Planctomycetota bacterium]